MQSGLSKLVGRVLTPPVLLCGKLRINSKRGLATAAHQAAKPN